MRLSTSPVGPVIVVALFCAALTAPVRAEPNHAVSPAEQAETASPAADDQYEPVSPSAWSFLNGQAASAENGEAAPSAAPAQPVAGLDGDTPEKPLSEEERQKLNQALLLDPAGFAAAPATPLRTRQPAKLESRGLNVSRNGSGTVVFDHPIEPVAGHWNAKVGADLGMSADQVAITNADNPLRPQHNGRAADAAWASVGLPVATVDARVNAGSDQGLVATTFKHSMPIGTAVSLTLQSRTSVTENFGRGASSFDVPMMAVPANDAAVVGQRVWGQENSAKFNIAPTGTSLVAGISANSGDTVTHNTLGAEQKVYGPLQVSTSITDVGQTGENKSVNARLKFHW